MSTPSNTTKIYDRTLLYSQRTTRFGLKMSIIKLRIILENIKIQIEGRISHLISLNNVILIQSLMMIALGRNM